MKKNISNIFKSVLVTYAFYFNINSYYLGNYDSLFNFNYLFATLLIFIFFYLFKKNADKSNKWIDGLSVIFSFFYVFGSSYMNTSTGNLVFGGIDLFMLSFLSAIGYFILFRYILIKIFKLLDSNYFTSDINLGKFGNIFNKHPFLCSMIIIIICWLPYIIAFYPAILSPDPSFQIKQFFGIWTKYNEYSVMVDPSVLITNHHPVVHTLLLGSCLKIGHILGNDNFGLFICSLIQIIFLSSTFAYSIKYLKEIGISNKIRFVALIIISIVPMFPLYSMSLVKDVIFSCFVMWFIIYLHRFIKGYKINWFLYILIILGMILFRHNGYHVMLFTFLIVLVLFRKYFKFALISLVLAVTLSTCYNDVVLPYFHITPGSVREILSLPFQQTARYYKYYKDEMDYEELVAIDEILYISDLDTRYREDISDPVKNKFNKYATDDDLKDYFKVWFDCFFKHPVVYLDATVNNIYGYFYPEKTNWYVYYNYDTRIVEDGFNYHYNSLDGLRNVLSSFAVSFPSIPVIGMISNIGFNVWFILVMAFYMFYRKRYSSVILLLPSFALILVCVLSPVNCYFRYALPYVFANTFVFGLSIERVKGDLYEKRSK